jgi:hypothetical protein
MTELNIQPNVHVQWHKSNKIVFFELNVIENSIYLIFVTERELKIQCFDFWSKIWLDIQSSIQLKKKIKTDPGHQLTKLLMIHSRSKNLLIS